MDLPGGQTQILNVRQIRWINRHPVEIDEDSTPETISATKNWLNWNCDLDHTNDSGDDCTANVQSDMKRDNGIEDPECTELQDVSTAPNIPRLI